MEDKKKKILEIFDKNILMVVSRVNSDGNPESAVVAFSHTNDLEVIFGTSCKSRKYKNLQENKNVSLVIGWENDETVQYEGVAREVLGEELEKCRKIHLDKIPEAEKHAFKEDERFFIIKPKWIRYTDISREEDKVFELPLRE